MSALALEKEKARNYNLMDMALALAPAFRDKFDFSNPEDYDRLAVHAYKAAEALVKKKDAMNEEAEAKWGPSILKEQEEKHRQLAAQRALDSNISIKAD